MINQVFSPFEESRSQRGNGMKQIAIAAVTTAILCSPVPTCAQTHHGLEARSWDEVSNRKSRALLGWNSFCYTPHCFSWRTIGGHEPHSREYSYYDGPRAHIRQPASGNSYWCGRRDLRSCLEFVMRTPAATGRTSDREVEIGNNRNVTVGSRRRKAMPIYLIGDSGVAKVQYVRH